MYNGMDRNNNRVFMFLSQKITIFEQRNELKLINKIKSIRRIV